MIYHPTFNHTWVKMLEELLSFGSKVHVRGSVTKEMLGHSVSFPMETAILTVKGRDLSYDFMFAEAWWILSGRNDVETLKKFAPSYSKFSDDGQRLSGAYGPKIMDQISWVVQTLKDDPHSRQAVINIWRERPGPSKDIPCTLSVQFLLRDGFIHTVVTMRSNDVWLGMPYDVFTMTMLTCMVAIELNEKLELGKMYHTAGSRHVYYKNSAKAKSCLDMWNTLYEDQPCAPRIILSKMVDSLDSVGLREILARRIGISSTKLNPFLYGRYPWLTL